MPVTIFFCYAREDKELLNKLKAHLSPLKQQELIEMWDDGEIYAGNVWDQEIKKHLNAAKIILLLASPYFMESDYCYGIEMMRALERHEHGETKVIPVILRPILRHRAPFNKLQALPTDWRPVTDWPNLDSALHDVAQGIDKVVEQLIVSQTSASSRATETIQQVAQTRTASPHIEQVRNVAHSTASLAVEKNELEMESLILFDGSRDHNDSDYLMWLDANPEGFVANVPNPLSSYKNFQVVMHRATCPSTRNQGSGGRLTSNTQWKVCSLSQNIAEQGALRYTQLPLKYCQNNHIGSCGKFWTQKARENRYTPIHPSRLLHLPKRLSECLDRDIKTSDNSL